MKRIFIIALVLFGVFVNGAFADGKNDFGVAEVEAVKQALWGDTYLKYPTTYEDNDLLLSEVFIFYRLMQNGYFEIGMNGWWNYGGIDYREPHDKWGSIGWLSHSFLAINTTPEVQSIGLIGLNPHWILEIDGDRLLTESVDNNGNYSQNWYNLSEFNEGKFIHPLTTYKKMYTKENGYFLYRKPIIMGFPDGTSRPNQNITRAEFVELLARVLNVEIISDGEKVFSDKPHWADDTINSFAKYEIVKGYPDGTFRPDNTISKAETIFVLLKAWLHIGYEYQTYPNDEVRGIQEFFAYELDWANLSHWNEQSKIQNRPPEWTKDALMALHPIIHSMTIEDYPNIDWSAPLKRHEAASLLTFLTGRGGHITVNYAKFTDYDPEPDPWGDFLWSPDVAMQTAAFDYEEFGHVGWLGLDDQQIERILKFRKFESSKKKN